MTNNSLILSLPAFFVRQLNLKKFLRLKHFLIIAVVSVCILAPVFIFQSNIHVGERYQVKNYQKRITQLAQENKILEVNSAKAGSLLDAENRIRELGFEKVGKIHYLQISENELVKK